MTITSNQKNLLLISGLVALYTFLFITSLMPVFPRELPILLAIGNYSFLGQLFWSTLIGFITYMILFFAKVVPTSSHLNSIFLILFLNALLLGVLL